MYLSHVAIGLWTEVHTLVYTGHKYLFLLRTAFNVGSGQ